MKKLLALITAGLCFVSHTVTAQERFRRQPPVPAPLSSPKPPRIDSHTLSNKLRLYVVNKTGLPIINLHLTVLTGEGSSPDDMPGLATFTANMLHRGTENLTASEIEERIDALGGTYRSTTFPDHTIFSLSVLEENLDQALELFSDMLIRPTFPRRQIEDLQRITFYDLANKRMDAEFAGKKLLYQLLFSEHAYRKIHYNDNIIRTYTQGTIRAFYRNFYRPNNALLVITGNLNIEQATLRVSRQFNTWEEDPSVERVHLQAPRTDIAPKVCFLEIPRMREAMIFMGTLLPPITSADYFPLLLLNQVLGGTQISRLFMTLRESKNYAYRANSAMEFFRACGVFYIQALVRTDVIEDSVQEILGEITRISTARIPNQEIETAKSFLLGQFPLSIETRAALASRIAYVQALNLSDEHLTRYYEKIMLLDSQTVYDTARRNSLFTPIIVIVGDTPILEHIGFDPIEVYNNNGEFIQTITRGERK
jgi:zinc protease